MKAVSLFLIHLLLPISILIAQPTVSTNIVSWGGIGEDYFQAAGLTPSGDIQTAGIRDSSKLIMVRYSSNLTRLGVSYFASPSSPATDLGYVKYAFNEEGDLAFTLEFNGTYRFNGRTLGAQSSFNNLALGVMNRDGTLRWVTLISKRGYLERQADALVYQNDRMYLSLSYYDGGAIVTNSRKIVFDDSGRYQTESSGASDFYTYTSDTAIDTQERLYYYSEEYPNAAGYVPATGFYGLIDNQGRRLFSYQLADIFSPLPSDYIFEPVNRGGFLTRSPISNNHVLSSNNQRYVCDWDFFDNCNPTNPNSIPNNALDVVKMTPSGNEIWSNRMASDDLALKGASMNASEQYIAIFSSSEPVTSILNQYLPPGGALTFYELEIDSSGNSQTLRRIVPSRPITDIHDVVISNGNQRLLVGELTLPEPVGKQGFVATY